MLVKPAIIKFTPRSIPINHNDIKGKFKIIIIARSSCTSPENKPTQNICLNPFDDIAAEKELILSSKK